MDNIVEMFRLGFGLRAVRGFASRALYNRKHEWVRSCGEGGTTRFGITKYAASKLPDIQCVVFIDTNVSAAGDEVCEIESPKAVEAISMPFSGRIVAVNEKLDDEPELVNEDPEGEGWLMELELELQEDKMKEDGWMSKEEYGNYLDEID